MSSCQYFILGCPWETLGLEIRLILRNEWKLRRCVQEVTFFCCGFFNGVVRRSGMQNDRMNKWQGESRAASMGEVTQMMRISHRMRSKFYSNKWRYKFYVHITLPPTPPPPQPVSIPSLMGDYASPMRPFIFPTCIRTQSLGERERASVEWILGASHAMLHYPHPRNVRPFIHSSAHLNTIRERPSSYRSSSCYDSDNICIIGKLSILKYQFHTTTRRPLLWLFITTRRHLPPPH